MGDPEVVQTVNGKKLVIFLGVGFFVFTIVMGFGTYFAANGLNSVLEKHAAHVRSAH